MVGGCLPRITEGQTRRLERPGSKHRGAGDSPIFGVQWTVSSRRLQGTRLQNVRPR